MRLVYLVACDEGSGEDAVNYNGSTSEAIGSDVRVGYGEVGLGTDASIS